VLGLLAGLVATAWPRLGELLGWTAVAPAWWIVTVARLSARLPGAVVEWGTSLPALAGLAGLCALVGLVVHWGLRRRAAAIAVAVLLVVAVLRPLPSPGWPPPGWVFVACDVGQGDALVVPTGETSALVVDAGPDPAEVQDCLADLAIGSVAALVVTHLHADHVDGIRGVLGALPVAQLQVGPVRTPRESWAAVSAAAAAADVPIRTVAAGSGFSAGAVDWRVLAPPVTTHPDLSDDAGEGSPVNDASVVLLVEVGGVRLLLTGDVEPTGQQALLRTGVDLHADVLKVPHHGSQRQDPSFLAAVGAPLSVVSVGADNGYGHPAPALLAHLGTGADQVARTDQHGDVAVVVDDGQLGWVAR
ncbi:MAG: MBL fold metallo-hydrolase, partial [Actinomycetota bacterium]|nr:MBL fold metallo-hydrolase [Actinomycetota bacterium]